MINIYLENEFHAQITKVLHLGLLVESVVR